MARVRFKPMNCQQHSSLIVLYTSTILKMQLAKFTRDAGGLSKFKSSERESCSLNYVTEQGVLERFFKSLNGFSFTTPPGFASPFPLQACLLIKRLKLPQG